MIQYDSHPIDLDPRLPQTRDTKLDKWNDLNMSSATATVQATATERSQTSVSSSGVPDTDADAKPSNESNKPNHPVNNQKPNPSSYPHLSGPSSRVASQSSMQSNELYHDAEEKFDNITNNDYFSNPKVTDINGKKNSMSSISENYLPPSTPSSFKNLNTDMLSNDTSPSSTNEVNNESNPNFEPLVQKSTSNSTITVHKSPLHVYEIDPLHVPPKSHNNNNNITNGDNTNLGNDETNQKTSLSSKPAPNQLASLKNRDSINTRRHTTNDLFTYRLKKNSLDQSSINSNRNNSISSLSSIKVPHNSSKRNRSSLDYLNRPVTTNDSANSEIQRMRNSILIKRNLRKRRKEFYEDDKVLIGNKISEGHENFVMAYNMLTGIRVAVSRCSGVMKNLTDDDFKSHKKLTFNVDGSELTPSSKYDFKFKDYCPEVFRDLRNKFGLDPADYLISITGKYILSELGSPGKSGSFFYYSRDFRFIIKTIRHSEHKQLRKILKQYHSHVKANPNTLVSQIYGLHRVKMPLLNGVKRKVHFIVMNNLFPPHRDIHAKYDLKGSTWGRYTNKPATEDKQLTKPMKDLNWLEDHGEIKFGPHKRKQFFQQLDKDVQFLKSVNVMDYSLLLGIHDVKNKAKSSSTTHNKLSIFDPKSNDKKELIKTNPRDINENDLPNDVYPGRSKFVFYGHDGGIRSTNENNEPLSEIYYLGVIDFLTNYSFRKRLETFWRTLSHSKETISAVPANDYGNRFLKFIKRSTANYKEKTA